MSLIHKISPDNGTTEYSIRDDAIAPVELTTTASKAYSVGDQFILDDGKIYKATANIAQGGTITVGTNCVEAGTVSEQLNGKQDTLTFDLIPTDGSTKPVQSNGIFDAITDVYSVMGENGALNILPKQTFEAQNGVTPSTDANGVITATGTASGGNFYKTYAFTNFTLKKGTYTFGLIDDNTNLVGDYTIQDSNNQAICQLYLNRPDERTKTFTLASDTVVKQSALYVKSGESASSLKISPYLYMGQVSDKAFYPPCMTNAELTDAVALNESELSTTYTTEKKALYKVGNIVYCYAKINGVTASVGDVIATIPSGYKPITEWRTLDANAKLIIIVDTNGNVKMGEAVNNRAIHIFTSWICS